MKPLLFLVLLLFVAATPAPTSTPDLSKIPLSEIQATIAHRNALNEQLLQQTLPAASQDVKSAVGEAQGLQVKIDALALTAAQVPVLQAELKKAHSACWRNLLIGAAAGAVLVLVGPTLLKLAGGLGAL